MARYIASTVAAAISTPTKPPLRIDQSSDRNCNTGKSMQREQLKNKPSINLNNAGRRITTPDATLAISHRHILQCRQTPSPQTAQTTLDPLFTRSSAVFMPCWKIIMRDHKHSRIVVFTHEHLRHPLVPYLASTINMKTHKRSIWTRKQTNNNRSKGDEIEKIKGQKEKGKPEGQPMHPKISSSENRHQSETLVLPTGDNYHIPFLHLLLSSLPSERALQFRIIIRIAHTGRTKRHK